MFINGTYTVATELHAYRGGAFFKALNAENMVVTMQANAQVKSTLSCFIEYDESLDLLNDRLKPYQIINGVKYPVGEFIITTAKKSTRGSFSGWQVEAYDKCLLVKQLTAENRITIPIGRKYLDVIQDFLQLCGIDKALNDPSDLATTTAREDWEPGTSYLTIINELLAEINYSSLWFDTKGLARLTKQKAVIADNVTQSYMPGEYSLLIDEEENELDAYTAYNVFKAVVSMPDKTVMTATAINESPFSPTSIPNRGMRICAPIEYLDDIASQAALQEYVDNLRDEYMLSNEVISFATAPIPTHEVGDIIALENGIYKETGWRLTLGYGGGFSHTAKRKVLI